MDSTRQQKYAKLIQKELSQIFQSDKKSYFEGAFITVTTVRVSPDLGLAKAYLSFMLVKDKEAMLEKINVQKKAIRKMLGDRIRNQARIIPELSFYLDDNVEYAAKIDELFTKFDIPPSKEEGEDEDKKKK